MTGNLQLAINQKINPKDSWRNPIMSRVEPREANRNSYQKSHLGSVI